MMDGDVLPPAILQRKAVVYVRQSTPAQVELNTESRRRQYELVEIARRRGFRTVDVIDDDLGRSASGMVARPGSRSLSPPCAPGKSAPCSALTLRGWHARAGTGTTCSNCAGLSRRVSSTSMGSHDPCLPNDRLLLGMKGSISEFELGVIRARMLDAARAKARRGELRISVPIGYIWHREAGLGLDPDFRLQQCHPAGLRAIPPTRQRTADASVAGGGGGVLSTPLGRQTPDLLRLDSDPLSQRHRAAEEPLLRRGLCLWKE